VQPDLIYVDSARASIITERGVEGSPTLVVEVISPSAPTIDRKTKFQLYARARVPFYWIADPDVRSIEAYELADAGYQLVKRISGPTDESLPPFLGLVLVPGTLWP
jgi:Uma2 family endonuclease